jgi:hypothetical protein
MKLFSRIAAIIFAIISLLHLARLITNFPVVLGNYELPMWLSGAGLVVAMILCIGLWKESRENQ